MPKHLEAAQLIMFSLMSVAKMIRDELCCLSKAILMQDCCRQMKRSQLDRKLMGTETPPNQSMSHFINPSQSPLQKDKPSHFSPGGQRSNINKSPGPAPPEPLLVCAGSVEQRELAIWCCFVGSVKKKKRLKKRPPFLHSSAPLHLSSDTKLRMH